MDTGLKIYGFLTSLDLVGLESLLFHPLPSQLGTSLNNIDFWQDTVDVWSGRQSTSTMEMWRKRERRLYG